MKETSVGKDKSLEQINAELSKNTKDLHMIFNKITTDEKDIKNAKKSIKALEEDLSLKNKEILVLKEELAKLKLELSKVSTKARTVDKKSKSNERRISKIRNLLIGVTVIAMCSLGYIVAKELGVF